MKIFKKQSLIFFGILLSASFAVMAKTDLEAQESYLKARVKSSQQNMDHSAHANQIDKSLDFHGVFYGYVPCDDCDGIKMTLSLKQNNNYLLVTQPARDSSREYYEKGKYNWDDENQLLVLTPNKDSTQRKYYIENEGTIVQLNSNGVRVTGSDADRYVLRRSDTVKSREVHIH